MKDRELSENGWEPTVPPWIVCAANQYGDYILVGARHWDSTMRATTELLGGGDFRAGWDILQSMIPEGGREIQGFIDQFGRFYGREEAEQVAQQNDQIIMDQRGGRLSNFALHSEDLY